MLREEGSFSALRPIQFGRMTPSGTTAAARLAKARPRFGIILGDKVPSGNAVVRGASELMRSRRQKVEKEEEEGQLRSAGKAGTAAAFRIAILFTAGSKG